MTFYLCSGIGRGNKYFKLIIEASDEKSLEEQINHFKLKYYKCVEFKIDLEK